jgi:UDP-N-acetylmuramoyl-tripeptide--D-alanyl-D-alanine ligase
MADAPLWTEDEIVSATAGRLSAPARGPLNGVSIDTRTLAPGDIFVAIKGERMDGHDFIEQALKAGAGAAIASRASDAMMAAGPVLEVGAPLRALEALGIAARARSASKIVAVTGSVGKTSTKEALKLALSASGAAHASSASFNNHWGVPLSLARLRRDAAYGIFEIGMNHAGEIEPLVKMVRPHIAIVTTIAPSHLGHFRSLDEIADAKAEIFSGLEPGGAAVINRDTPYFGRLAHAARAAGVSNIVGFGVHDSSEVRLVQLKLHAECSCITADVMGEELIYKLGAPGEHMALNSLSVLAAMKLSGADLARGALALAAAEPAKGRGVRKQFRAKGGTFLVIDESYNANPASVRAALALLAQAKGRKIAVLGDMLELGEHGEALHASLDEAVLRSGVDVLYAAGPLMARLWEKTPQARRGRHARASADLRDALLADIRAGDTVMIKGSLGSKMGPLVDAIAAQFEPAGKDG